MSNKEEFKVLTDPIISAFLPIAMQSIFYFKKKFSFLASATSFLIVNVPCHLCIDLIVKAFRDSNFSRRFSILHTFCTSLRIVEKMTIARHKITKFICCCFFAFHLLTFQLFAFHALSLSLSLLFT